MVLHSTRWLALSYFTYFFSYGIFLPFWSVWLAGNGLTPETIGILLGAGLVARFLGSLLIAPRVSDPSRLISALRVLALREVGDYLRPDERLAGEGLTVTMTLREALSQFVARRCETLPVVDAEGRPCGTLHFADLLRQEMSHEGAS